MGKRLCVPQQHLVAGRQLHIRPPPSRWRYGPARAIDPCSPLWPSAAHPSHTSKPRRTQVPQPPLCPAGRHPGHDCRSEHSASHDARHAIRSSAWRLTGRPAGRPTERAALHGARWTTSFPAYVRSAGPRHAPSFARYGAAARLPIRSAWVSTCRLPFSALPWRAGLALPRSWQWACDGTTTSRRNRLDPWYYGDGAHPTTFRACLCSASTRDRHVPPPRKRPAIAHSSRAGRTLLSHRCAPGRVESAAQVKLPRSGPVRALTI